MDRGALIVLPSHVNCKECEEEFLQLGLDVRAYPARLTKKKKIRCHRCKGKEGNLNCPKCFGFGHFEITQNCWNRKADDAEAMGLPVGRTVCLQCPDRKKCRQCGYLCESTRAARATISIATHARAAWTGLPKLGSGRRFWGIHEHAVDVLRPVATISPADLHLSDQLLNTLLQDPFWLNWFGSGKSNFDRQRRGKLFRFCTHLANITAWLRQQLQSAHKTKQLTYPAAMKRPSGIESFLFRRSQQYQVSFADQPWRLLLAAASAELHALGLVFDQRYAKSCGKNMLENKTVMGVWSNNPSKTATVWFCDATITQKRLSRLLGHSVTDKTPTGALAFAQRTVQIPRDITRRTTPKTIQNVMRGILAEFPQAQHLGIICHRPHIPAIEACKEQFGTRIEKIAHFGGGEDRSSNEWYERCDTLVVLGTPRVPPAGLREYLVQVGEFDAAGRTPKWTTRLWEGTTESGKVKIVKGRGYVDPDWHEAHEDLVRAAIIQAVGRGRSILKSGCKVLVFSTEECGLPLIDTDVQLMSESEAAVLNAVEQLALQNPNISILGKGSAKSSEVASATKLSTQQTRKLLAKLADRGSVEKVGERGGWRLANRIESRTGQTETSDEPPLSLAEANQDEGSEIAKVCEEMSPYHPEEWDEGLRNAVCEEAAICGFDSGPLWWLAEMLFSYWDVFGGSLTLLLLMQQLAAFERDLAMRRLREAESLLVCNV